MIEAHWLQTCARRLMEIDKTLGPPDANIVAIRLWLGHQSPIHYRAMHPVAAAEAWHAHQAHALRHTAATTATAAPLTRPH